MYRTIQHYRDALRTYITSTYHVSNPALVDMRAELLQAWMNLSTATMEKSSPVFIFIDSSGTAHGSPSHLSRRRSNFISPS